jgi:hypothetical protein
MLMLGNPWPAALFVYSTASQIGNSSVPLVFSYIYYFILNIQMDFCVILEYIVHYVYDVSFWYICVHIFYIKGTYSRITIQFNGF